MNVLHISNRSKVSANATDPQDMQALAYARQQRAGGVAALYLAAAYLVAMPYFLIVVNYESLVGSAQKVAALVANQNSMYVMYLVTYVVFGIVLAALALALWKRLAGSPSIAAVVVAEGALVVVDTTMSGRHVGPFVLHDSEGAVETVWAPTGKTFAVRQSHWLRVADGLVIEHWAVRDDLGQGFQLGWVPPSPLYLLRCARAKRRAIRASSTR
jgi:SnoaL-like polyketide cyclase